MNNKETMDVNTVYNEYLKDFPLGHYSAVGWTTKETQYKRFEALFGVGITDNTSLLDYGCGLGHLNDYINLNGYKNINYTGIDINPNYITYAIMRYPGQRFLCTDIEPIDEKFDYVIGSGVFTIIIELNDVIKKIEKAYEICNKSVAFNFLHKKSELYPLNLYEPKELLSRLSHIPNIEIIDNYLINEDFTIYIKK